MTLIKSLQISALIMALAAVPAIAKDNEAGGRFKGEYDLSLFRSCVQTAGGFGSNFENIGPTHTRTSEATGTMTLNRDGTGLIELLVTTIRGTPQPPLLNSNIIVSDSTCSVNYTVEADDSLKIAYGCVFNTTAGIGAPNSGTTSGNVLRGRMTRSGDLIALSSYDSTGKELLTTDPSSAVNGQRICNRHGVAVRK